MVAGLKLNERLIVAADYDPHKVGGVDAVVGHVFELASMLEGSGVVIKVNSVLRLAGYDLIHQLHDLGVGCMADLKLNDIPETMRLDGSCVGVFKPEIVTVMASAGSEALFAFRRAVGEQTCVLAVTVLTSLGEPDCHHMFRCPSTEAVGMLAEVACAAGVSGLVCSGKEVAAMRERYPNLELITPGIRPVWSMVSGDDQKRVVTPHQAILYGATRIVVGRPITGAPDPMAAVQKTLDEIHTALQERGEESVR